MKTLSKILTLTLALMLVVTTVNAQKKAAAFNGKVTYEITYPDAEIDPAMAGQLPTEMTVVIAGNKHKTEMITGMMSNIVIIDDETKKAVILLDIMGMKYAIRSSKEEMQANQEEKPVIKITDETKEIAGYTCKKVQVTDAEGDETMEVWVTEDIMGDYENWGGAFPGVKGLAMEYVTDNNGMKMQMTVKSVSKGKFKDKDFLIPSDYKEVTREELREIFGSFGAE